MFMSMFRFLKLACIAVYALALGSFFGWPRGDFSLAVRAFAALMLVVHAIELPFALRHLKRDSRSLLAGIGLTLLFGVLHWLPLARRDKLRGD